MLTFDLHYHPNVHNLSGRRKRRRVLRHLLHFKRAKLDVVACTEHSYNKPLDAYLSLAEYRVARTLILPGVEYVTREGIDIILLFQEEADLRHCLDRHESFRWSVWDVQRIARDRSALSIVPHPFFVGRTCAGRILADHEYQRLLGLVDYVETHNGACLSMLENMSNPLMRRYFRKTVKRFAATSDLPMSLRGLDLGWSVGSDAHFPGEQYIVGGTDREWDEPSRAAAFALLRERLRFDQVPLFPTRFKPLHKISTLAKNGQCVLREAVRKRKILSE